MLVDPAHRAAGENGDALLLHLLAHMRAHVVVEAAQDVVAAIDQRHVGAEACKDAGEFQRDVAAALDQDALRLLLKVKHLVGGDHVLDAGNLRRRDWAWRPTAISTFFARTRSPFDSDSVCASSNTARALTISAPALARLAA